MLKRIIIAGSREFTDYDLFSLKVDEILTPIKDSFDLIILSGHARGTDKMAEQYAKERGYQLEIFKADWSRYGKGAGPKRNEQMILCADYVIAFPGSGNGTKNLISLAKKNGLPTVVININYSLTDNKQEYTP